MCTSSFLIPILNLCEDRKTYLFCRFEFLYFLVFLFDFCVYVLFFIFRAKNMRNETDQAKRTHCSNSSSKFKTQKRKRKKKIKRNRLRESHNGRGREKSKLTEWSDFFFVFFQLFIFSVSSALSASSFYSPCERTKTSERTVEIFVCFDFCVFRIAKCEKLKQKRIFILLPFKNQISYTKCSQCSISFWSDFSSSVLLQRSECFPFAFLFVLILNESNSRNREAFVNH